MTTKNGNYFYILIDRDDEGENTVHFLDKLLAAAEIVNQRRVPVRGEGFFLFGFLVDNAAVVGRVVLSLRGLRVGGDGKA